MAELLTRVEIHFLPEFLNYWLRFGNPSHSEDLDRRRAFDYFAPGQVFGYIRWEANEYGTKDWCFYVIRAGDTAFPLDRVPGVTPGGEVLLELRGNPKIKKALEAIDAMEAQGFDPADVSPSHFIHIHNRILIRLPIHPYGMDQHRAHLRHLELSA